MSSMYYKLNRLKFIYQKWFDAQRYYFDSRESRKQIRFIFKTNPNITNRNVNANFLKESKQFLIQNFNGYNCTDWHRYYAAFTKIHDVRFIPTDLYFTKIEPTLNNHKTEPGISDKIAYDIYFPKQNLPETVFKIINNKYYTAENDFIEKQKAIKILAENYQSLVLKPSMQTGGGKNVIIDNANHIIYLLANKPVYSHGSFVVQNKLQQHEIFRKIHPESINTLRIMTARVNSDIVNLSSYLRMGRNGSVLDNGQSGGLFCRIFENGKLDKFAYDKNLFRFEKHPNSNLVFKDFNVPFFSEALNFCKLHHKRFLRFAFISWDISISPEGIPVFIEFNLKRQSIHGHQIINGPIFGEHTNYFIELYNQIRKTKSLAE